MMDSLIDSSLEQQIISRAYRMGARASVKVDVVFSGTYVDDRYTNMLIYLCTVLMIINKFIMNNFIFQFFNSIFQFKFYPIKNLNTR